jgi:hypothetical protein
VSTPSDRKIPKKLKELEEDKYIRKKLKRKYVKIKKKKKHVLMTVM